MKKIRTRIAPSPTGDPHVGTAYIALFNYVFAKSQGGEFYVRIENTDQKRCTKESEDRIFEALNWLNLTYDELSNFSNFERKFFDHQDIDFIKQSKRLDIYKQHAELLVNENKAYKCYCSKERLEQLAKENPYNLYHENCVNEGDSFVIRLKSSNKEISFIDGIRGKISSSTYLRDPILLKSDGYPTYHLASVIDDHFMEITHVIRGEEWISSTPIHIELYSAFGWELPEFYHLSLLRNKDNTKLSKRHNPTSILYYRDLGILPETLLNYLGTLGFSLGNGKERFDLDEMIENFSWDKVSVNGPVFDVDKLKAFNKNDLQNLDPDVAKDFIVKDFEKIFELAKTRVSTLSEIIPLMSFCFGELPKYDQESLGVISALFDRPGRSSGENVRKYLGGILKEFESQPLDQYESVIKNYFTTLQLKPKEYFPLINTIITGQRSCPPVFEIMKIIGKDITLKRFRHFLELNAPPAPHKLAEPQND